jgi:hypothetical protein
VALRKLSSEKIITGFIGKRKTVTPLEQFI